MGAFHDTLIFSLVRATAEGFSGGLGAEINGGSVTHGKERLPINYKVCHQATLVWIEKECMKYQSSAKALNNLN